MKESELTAFYTIHRKLIKEQCHVLGIELSDVEMFTSSENPGKVTYKYNDRIILTAECEQKPTYKIRRYRLQ